MTRSGSPRDASSRSRKLGGLCRFLSVEQVFSCRAEISISPDGSRLYGLGAGIGKHNTFDYLTLAFRTS